MSLDNARVRFYFQNQARIEEWTALRMEAAAAAHAWLVGLEPEMRRLAGELGDDVLIEAKVDDAQGWPCFRLYRRTWRCGAEFPVSVILQWPRNGAMLTESGQPYVALDSGRGTPIGVALRNSPAVQETRKRRKETTSIYCVAWGRVPPNGPFPDTADEYRKRLVDALEGAWKVYAPLVDEAVSGVPAVP